MEISSTTNYTQTNQSQEFLRNSSVFYPSPSTLKGDSDLNKANIGDKSQPYPNSFKSPYGIEENQFNNLFNNNEDIIKDNNLRNDSQSHKIMNSNSIFKQKYVTFILNNETKSTSSKDSNKHDMFSEKGNRFSTENKNINGFSRDLKTPNADQRSARKGFVRPSAASNAILNRKLATAKSSSRKKDNFLGSSMPLSISNIQHGSNHSESLAKKSSIVSIIVDNL